MKVEASAPGKVILSGEHSVVFGKRAIALSVDRRTTVTIENNFGTNIWRFKSKSLNFEISYDISELRPLVKKLKKCEFTTYYMSIRKALFSRGIYTNHQESAVISCFSIMILICKSYDKKFRPMKICVTSELPMTSGLGSSASYSVSLAASLLAFYEIIKPTDLPLSLESSEQSLRLISEFAYKSEFTFHGRPSGIDNTVCTYGNGLIFQNGEHEQIRGLRRLKLLIVNTKGNRNTSSLVESVRLLKEKYPVVIDSILESMNTLTTKMETLLRGTYDYSKLKDLLKVNHGLLVSLGVSNKLVDNVCNIATTYGFCAKMTGAGGGGCAIILVPDHNVLGMCDMVKEFESLGCECLNCLLGDVGVQLKIDL